MKTPIKVTGYIIKSPIKLNGKRLAPGSRIKHEELDQDEAELLTDQGVIEPSEWLEDVGDDQQSNDASNSPKAQESAKKFEEMGDDQEGHDASVNQTKETTSVSSSKKTAKE